LLFLLKDNTLNYTKLNISNINNFTQSLPKTKIVVVSTIVLSVSAVALGIIFLLGYPLTHVQGIALYMDSALGGAAIGALILSGAFKLYAHYSKNQKPTDSRIPYPIRKNRGRASPSPITSNDAIRIQPSTPDSFNEDSSVLKYTEEIDQLLPYDEEFKQRPEDKKNLENQQKLYENGYEIAENLKKRGLAYISEGYCDPFKINYQNLVDLTRMCVKKQDRNGLRMLAHILFSGPWKVTRIKIFVFPSRRLLKALIYDPNSELIDIGRVLLQCYQDWRAIFSPPHYKKSIVVEDISRSNDEGGGILEYPCTCTVKITHGGGNNHILSFFNGESNGYPLEISGIGLQVSPYHEKCPLYEQVGALERTEEYATKGFIQDQFDVPASLSAGIQYNILKPANNGYEAGLLQQDVRYLEDIIIQRHSIRCISVSISIDEMQMLEKTLGPDLIERAKNCLLRHEKQMNFYLKRNERTIPESPPIDFTKLNFNDCDPEVNTRLEALKANATPRVILKQKDL
jgi:hypothetical protein